MLARLPLLHPEGLRGIDDLGPAQSLRWAVRHRSSLVKRRSGVGVRLDALVELLGPAWAEVLGTGDYNEDRPGRLGAIRRSTGAQKARP